MTKRTIPSVERARQLLHETEAAITAAERRQRWIEAHIIPHGEEEAYAKREETIARLEQGRRE